MSIIPKTTYKTSTETTLNSSDLHLCFEELAQSVFALSLELDNLFADNHFEKLFAHTAVRCLLRLGKKPAHRPKMIFEAKIFLWLG